MGLLSFDLYKTFSGRGRERKVAAQGEIALGSTASIYGKSGVGKSTILRLLAGLEVPDRGFIQMGEREWFNSENKINSSIQKRNIGFVFQDYNLFPNMSVRKNLLYAAGKKIPAEIHHLLEKTGLTDLLDVSPYDLSGGERQRISIIRSLCQRPDLLLLDEPFSALDDEAIEVVIRELKLIQTEIRTTIILVSHRKDVVLEMADLVIHMIKDEPTRQGIPSELLHRSF